MKDKSKVLKTYGYMFDKLQFICLIGGGTRRPQVRTRPPPIRQINCSLYLSLISFRSKVNGLTSQLFTYLSTRQQVNQYVVPTSSTWQYDSCRLPSVQ